MRSLATSTALSKYYFPGYIQSLDVIKVLKAAGVQFVLAGHNGIGGWMGKPRTTDDVDIVVPARQHKKSVKVLLTAFLDLEEVETPFASRLRKRGKDQVVIDVLRSNQGVFRAAMSHTHLVRNDGIEYMIPSLEMALAMKFAPLANPRRRQMDKFQDAHDFAYMAESNPEIDLQVLEDLGEMVCPGGGKEILEVVRKVIAGEKLDI